MKEASNLLEKEDRARERQGKSGKRRAEQEKGRAR